MINKDRKKERFLRDTLPVRLAGIAADLARVASSARSPSGGESVLEMLEESQYFIEWTAAEADLEVAAELVDIQRGIAAWRGAWQEACQIPSIRNILSITARKWSDQILAMSGLLNNP